MIYELHHNAYRCRDSEQTRGFYEGFLGLPQMLAKGKAAGIETRGVSDHQFIHSIYFRDPNGYVIELCAKQAGHDAEMNPAINGAHEKLRRWTTDRNL